MRKVFETDSVNGNFCRVYYNHALNEYQVRLYKQGKLYEPADYFTDDRKDAESTAMLMLKNIK